MVNCPFGMAGRQGGMAEVEENLGYGRTGSYGCG
jgi:hypothetical protein